MNINLKPPNGNGDFMKWIANLARLVFYVGAISTGTWFVFKNQENQQEQTRQIMEIRADMLRYNVAALENADKRRAILRQADNRLRRLYQKNGWEYAELEPLP